MSLNEEDSLTEYERGRLDGIRLTTDEFFRMGQDMQKVSKRLVSISEQDDSTDTRMAAAYIAKSFDMVETAINNRIVKAYSRHVELCEATRRQQDGTQ
jgi:hypothetical protein